MATITEDAQLWLPALIPDKRRFAAAARDHRGTLPCHYAADVPK
jgi:hypothetical protein